MAEPVDVLEIAADRLAWARAAVINRMQANACPDPRRATIDMEIARIELSLAQRDMASVARVIGELSAPAP